MQPLWMTFGLWLRMLVAGLIAAFGIATLLVLEFVMIASVTVVFLALVPWVLAVCLLLVVPWLVVATVYRWVIPIPLVVGRIGHDPLAKRLNRWLAVSRIQIPARCFAGAASPSGCSSPGSSVSFSSKPVR